MNNLLKSIKINEGFKPRVYKDTLGIDTIGYGFAIKDLHLDEDLSEEILKRKVNKLIKRIYKTFDWFINMPEDVQEVVVEMCYQMGVSGFSKFKKTIKLLSEKQFTDASTEMLDSLWAKQTPIRALKLSNIVGKAKG